MNKDALLRKVATLEKKGDVQGAIQALDQYLVANSADAEIWSKLARLVYLHVGAGLAIQLLKRAVSMVPGSPMLHSNLGVLLVEANNLEAAVEHYRAAVTLDPARPEYRLNLAGILQEMGRVEEALIEYEAASSLDPRDGYAVSQAVHLCQNLLEWRRLPVLVERTRKLIREGTTRPCFPFPLVSMPDLMPGEIYQAIVDYARNTLSFTACLNRPPLFHAEGCRGSSRLRIAYLSADFYAHATAFLISGVFESHDREQFEILAYSYGPSPHSEVRDRMVASFDRFTEIRGLSYLEAARKIADDRVDILVDLKGYTQGCRPEIAMLRPAPVQATWLGFPGTSGHSRVADYLIGDPVVSPLSDAEFFSEKLALMPNCYQPTDNQRRTGALPSRTAVGLPEDAIVFANFNQIYKLLPEIFDVWCRLLRAVPDSVLWTLRPKAGSAEKNLLREAISRNISAERIIFADNLPQPDHLARMSLADIALDTFPCTSHTTASDLLWVGVPLITRCGKTFPSRVAASVLKAAGLADLAVETNDEFFALACHYATDRDALARLRQRVSEARSSPLFDTRLFARNLERLYRKMWENHLSKQHGHIILS